MHVIVGFKVTVGTGVSVAITGVSVGWSVLVGVDVGELGGKGMGSLVTTVVSGVAAVAARASGVAIGVGLQLERTPTVLHPQMSRATVPRLVMVALRAEQSRRQFRMAVSTPIRLAIIHPGWSARYPNLNLV